jgi:predicted extracellular nuclease
VIVLGDLNDSHDSAALGPLRDAGLYPLMADLPAARRYTYVFEGNAEALDHVFVDEQARQRVVAFDVAHVDADFARAASDHDPVVVRLAF